MEEVQTTGDQAMPMVPLDDDVSCAMYSIRSASPKLVAVKSNRLFSTALLATRAWFISMKLPTISTLTWEVKEAWQ